MTIDESGVPDTVGTDTGVDTRSHDKRRLHELGYAQELDRSMSGFSNFAVSFIEVAGVGPQVVHRTEGPGEARGAGRHRGRPGVGVTA
jgi:hypothetical protein